MRPWSWVLLLVMLALVRATVELAAADNEGSEDAPRQVVPAASLGELVRLGEELPLQRLQPERFSNVAAPFVFACAGRKL